MRSIWLALALLLSVCAFAQVQGASSTAKPGADPASSSPSSSPTLDDLRNPNRSCKVDSDCQVKNVGSCCGANPECVNKDAATDPDKVRAQCTHRRGIGMCRVPRISGCSCVSNQCTGIKAADAHPLH